MEQHIGRLTFDLTFLMNCFIINLKIYNIINVVQMRDWHRTIWKMVIQKNRSQKNTATKLYCIYFYNIYLESDGSWIDSNDDRWSAKLPAFYLILSDTKTLYHTWFFSYAWPRISKLNHFVARKKKHFYSLLYWLNWEYFKNKLTPHSFIAFRELYISFLVRFPSSRADRLQFGKHGPHAEYETAASQSGSWNTLSSFSTINRLAFEFFSKSIACHVYKMQSSA